MLGKPCVQASTTWITLQVQQTINQLLLEEECHRATCWGKVGHLNPSLLSASWRLFVGLMWKVQELFCSNPEDACSNECHSGVGVRNSRPATTGMTLAEQVRLPCSVFGGGVVQKEKKKSEDSSYCQNQDRL